MATVTKSEAVLPELKQGRTDSMTSEGIEVLMAHRPVIGSSAISLGLWRRHSTVSWMTASFLVAAALAAIVFGTVDAHDRVGMALRITGRWSFLWFWLAYTGSAVATLWGPRFSGLARHGREFGLAFASAQLVHVGLILWSGAGAGMAFFWVGIVFTYLIALLSLARLRDAIGQRFWRISLVIALNYIALVFAADFVGEPLKKGGITSYPLSYLPFALMLIVGVGLRVATFVHRKLVTRAAARIA
jgi:hypothetical protein